VKRIVLCTKCGIDSCVPHSIISHEGHALRTVRCVTYGIEKCETTPQLEQTLAHRHALVLQLLAQRVPYEQRMFHRPQ